jgi:hypothetical protein
MTTDSHPLPAAPKKPTRVAKVRPYARLSPEQQASIRALCDDIYLIFPSRDIPHVFLPFRTAIVALVQEEGVTPHALYQAALNYGVYCAKAQTEPKYIKSLHRFYADGVWEHYQTTMVHGRTRQEWARSGQDVAEFDRLAHQQTEADV